jgi:uncharacterized protein
VNPNDIILKYYKPGTLAYDLLMVHSTAVRNLALKIAGNNPQLNINTALVARAAMLHDIGIFKTNAHDLGCFGQFPYVCHGYLGREILEMEGLPELALFCERHTGTGLSKEEIIAHNLPVPIRDMLPVTTEEKLICYADKFFSKSAKHPERPKKMEKIIRGLSRFGDKKVAGFEAFIKMFGVSDIYEDEVD